MKELRPALVSCFILTVLTGLAFPLALAGLARAVFPRQAEGSLIRRQGAVAGSALIGQVFSAPGDFWGRPSATTDTFGHPLPCNAANSGGSNLAPDHPGLRQVVQARLDALRAADPDQGGPVPVDLVTASGSGLDPHLSPAAAAYQAHRVAKARGLAMAQVQDLVAAHTEQPQWGLLGEARVNVLALNLALDAAQGR